MTIYADHDAAFRLRAAELTAWYDAVAACSFEMRGLPRDDVRELRDMADAGSPLAAAAADILTYA